MKKIYLIGIIGILLITSVVAGIIINKSINVSKDIYNSLSKEDKEGYTYNSDIKDGRNHICIYKDGSPVGCDTIKSTENEDIAIQGLIETNILEERKKLAESSKSSTNQKGEIVLVIGK